jgi:hypothetical protein
MREKIINENEERKVGGGGRWVEGNRAKTVKEGKKAKKKMKKRVIEGEIKKDT